MAYGTLGKNAYRIIRRQIVSGRLGAGAVVSEESLASEIGVSRTPVREAIRRLHHEGLVEQVPRYGTIVHTPHRREIIELYGLLEPLYAWVGVNAAGRIADRDLRLMERLSEQMRDIAADLRRRLGRALTPAEVRSWLELDALFYMAPVIAAGNAQIVKIIRNCRAQLRLAVHTLPPFNLQALAKLYHLQQRLIRALHRRDAAHASHVLVQTVECRRSLVLQSHAEPADPADQVPLDADFAEELSELEAHMSDDAPLPGSRRRSRSPAPGGRR